MLPATLTLEKLRRGIPDDREEERRVLLGE